MPMSWTATGSYKRTEDFLAQLQKFSPEDFLKPFGQQGVDALILATPKDSGLAAESWFYQIKTTPDYVELSWHNRDVENGGFPVAVVLQYGYSTGTGGYVQGRDYINPAMKPIFDRIESELRKAVSR